MCEVNCVAIELGGVLKGQAIIILAVPIIVGLQSVYILVQDLVWVELFVSAEGRRVLVLESALGPSCLVVCNVLALALPTDLAAFPCVRDRVHQWPHTLRVRGVRLHEVAKIESVGLVFSSVLYAEIVPLRKTLCSIIIFQE